MGNRNMTADEWSHFCTRTLRELKDKEDIEWVDLAVIAAIVGVQRETLYHREKLRFYLRKYHLPMPEYMPRPRWNVGDLRRAIVAYEEERKKERDSLGENPSQ